MKHYWVYMVRCADGSFYVGVTNDAQTRVAQHNAGIDILAYTFRRRPVQLVFAQAFYVPEEAIDAEKRLKGWSRAKKEALTRGDWDEIRRLARGGDPLAARLIAGDHPSTSSG